MTLHSSSARCGHPYLRRRRRAEGNAVAADLIREGAVDEDVVGRRLAGHSMLFRFGERGFDRRFDALPRNAALPGDSGSENDAASRGAAAEHHDFRRLSRAGVGVRCHGVNVMRGAAKGKRHDRSMKLDSNASQPPLQFRNDDASPEPFVTHARPDSVPAGHPICPRGTAPAAMGATTRHRRRPLGTISLFLHGNSLFRRIEFPVPLGEIPCSEVSGNYPGSL